MALTPVPVARKALLDSIPEPTGAETLPLAQCAWRVLAGEVKALRTQPPFANSAMDGYAVRGDEMAEGVSLTVIGESAAGRAYEGVVGPGQTVRIFTGAPMPEGADTILMQEDADGVGSPVIRVRVPPSKGKFLRAAGLDFHEGDILLSAGRFLAPTFERLVLTAPMLGLPQPITAPGFRRFCLRLAVYCGAGGRYIPGQRRRRASVRTFERNPLTSDPDRYRINEAISAARPVCRLAAPTLGWVAAATRMFDRLAAPDLADTVPAPVMLVNSGADTVVSRLAIETMARRLRNPAYVLIHGARHEVMMEREVYAAQFWAAFDAFIPGSSE